MEWHIIGILAFIVIYNLYRYYHEDEDNDNDYSPVTTTTPESNHIEETCMEETISTSKLQNFRDIRKSLCSFFATISQLIFNLRNLNNITMLR